MKRRQWTAKDKLAIVLQGLKGEISVAELCNQHQISQSQYYKWRDRLLAEGAKVFEHAGPNRVIWGQHTYFFCLDGRLSGDRVIWGQHTYLVYLVAD